MKVSVFALKAAKKIYQYQHRLRGRLFGRDRYQEQLYEASVQYFDQQANDQIYAALAGGRPLMVSKFGTIELSALANFRAVKQGRASLSDHLDFITGQMPAAGWLEGMGGLCRNAGFFPEDPRLLEQFYDINVAAIKEIDFLGSYKKAEKAFADELAGAVRVNLDGYYAPYFFNQPWTRALEGKRVLVVHPFEESVRAQYAKRQLLWENVEVLPDFELITLKAVQTIGGQKSEFATWFDALEFMKQKISAEQFDIALIGCGAYGMPLAAHVKNMGRQAVHLAGWLQVLFGIRGQRWVDDPRVAKFMNASWASPQLQETPSGHKKIESGCYW